MGVASVCGEQEASVASESGGDLWVWLLGVVVRRYIDSSYYLSLLLLYLFPTFCSFKNVFRSCSSTFCNYILCPRSINTHTGNYGRPTAAI